ncbi:DUF5786 family protein [Halosimplex aquaticum]|uniref:DUF5786 family protein n=1 Tax=Halosimplex aquaticum TaxID=3026162 RepID=A0ABD5XTR6_9EURY|nr:DUF5786 family protein [Halosimplex aquaticum]
MGFGSYDESEQQDQNVDTDESEGVNIHENDHEGEITFETEASTDDLVDRLEDIKDSSNEA